MDTVSAVPEERGRSRRPRYSNRAISWPLAGLALILAFALASSSVGAQEEEETCEDYTERHRPCTAMEEYGYCLTNATESFITCADGAGVLRTLGCVLAFDVDYVACTAALPLDVLKKVMK